MFKNLCALVASLFALATVSVGPSTAWGFDRFPEFHMLQEDEALSFDRSVLIDSEYQSDVVTYIAPLAWDADFFAQARGFDMSFGSLSNRHFLEQQRLKVDQPLTDSLSFRFTYFQQRDLEIDQRHAVIELVQKLTSTFAVSLYGEPSHYKRENDFGVALLYQPSVDHELRLFHTWVDFTRGEHNDQPDSFVKGSEPRSFGFVGRCYDCLGPGREEGQATNGETTATKRDRTFLEYFVRRETPVLWHFPLQGTEYAYEFWSAGFSTRWAPQEYAGVFINTRVQYSKKFEAEAPLTGSSTTQRASLVRDVTESMVSAEFPLLGASSSSLRLEPGLAWIHRAWRGDQDQLLDHRNLLPFVWLRANAFRRAGSWPDQVELGYESTFFSSQNSVGSAATALPLAAIGLKPWSVEHRLNFRYVFALGERASLSITATADVDVAFGNEGGLFEGGQGQFRLVF
jgi:hypothetical protein